MKKNLILFCAIATLATVASAQVSSQNSASTQSNTAVSASQNGANISSNSDVSASSQTSASQPKHEPRTDAKDSKHNDRSKGHDEKGGSMDASGALAAGTTVNAVLSKPIDSRKCKPGDEVVATASQDVKADGKVVLKKGSKLIGHVTQASAKGEGQANSSLGIMFDRAIGKDGQQIQMNSVVQAIAAAQTSTAASSMGDDMGSMGSGSVASTGSARGGSGLVGGVTSTASSATGAAANAGGNATGAVNSTLNSTANVGGGLNGTLNSTSTGVAGLNGLSLASNASNATQGSIITSTGKSVHLDSGTQMMLKVVKQ